MNKFLSYVVLDLEDSEGNAIKVPIKIGAYVLENVALDFGLDLYEIGKLFKSIPHTNEKGEERMLEIPAEPIKFYKSILIHGANYAALVEGKSAFQEKDAYEWLDQIGFKSEKSQQIFFAFMGCIQNGGTPIKLTEGETDKKKAHDVSDPA